MNIALLDVTVTVSYGGIQTAVWELARALCDLGHEITVYGGDGPIRPDLGGRDIRIRTFPFTDRERVPNFGSRFRRIVERWSFSRHALPEVASAHHDWVILTKPFDFFWPRVMPADSRTRFAFRSGGTDFFPGDRMLKSGISAWFANSHFNSWQIKSRYGIYPKVIYNGVDVERFSPQRRDPELRRQLGIAPEETVCIFAGRLVGWKGVHVTLKALADASLRDLPLRCIVIGDGPEREALQRQAAALGLQQRVLFESSKPHGELPRWWASADLGVFSSIGDEGFSNSIAEALASGLPAIATAFSGNPETVGNEGSCGLLVTPGDSRELAQAIGQLARDPEQRRSMGERARARITREFTWDHVARRLLDEIGRASCRERV